METKKPPPGQDEGPKGKPIRGAGGLRQEVAGALNNDYPSGLVDSIRAGGSILDAGHTRLVLAKEFGFCYGVDRAVELAYETVARFADRRIFITAEIIHNPQVNNRLRRMGVRFLSGPLNDGATFDDIQRRDVVILPAFGVSVEVKRLLEAKGCLVVDTTCGSVVRVWKRVESNAREGFASIIHGAYMHEETMATVSAARAAGGRCLVVRDRAEAQWVCDMIEGRMDPAAFLERFAPCASADFDPEEDLRRVGLANQTTMLSSESLEIAEMIRQAMERRHGADYVRQNYRTFDTICTATQDRQNAVQELAASRPDLVLIVGGFNSSNTGHLRQIAARFAPAYHIEGAECLISAEEIRHKQTGAKDPVVDRGWLPRGPLTVGLASGASTPNRVTGEVIERLLQLRGEAIKSSLPSGT